MGLELEFKYKLENQERFDTLLEALLRASLLGCGILGLRLLRCSILRLRLLRCSILRLRLGLLGSGTANGIAR